MSKLWSARRLTQSMLGIYLPHLLHLPPSLSFSLSPPLSLSLSNCYYCFHFYDHVAICIIPFLTYEIFTLSLHSPFSSSTLPLLCFHYSIDKFYMLISDVILAGLQRAQV